MELSELLLYFGVILAGILAGIINTLAGNGSAITLTFLVFLGLPATVANGTNRVGILFQTLIAYRNFDAKGWVSKKGAEWMIVPAIIGALIGASFASMLDDEHMSTFLGCLMIVLLIAVLSNPKKWIANQSPEPKDIKNWKTVLIFLLVGFHGGFVQAGVGILLLAALVLGLGFGLNQANGTKLLVVLFFTLPALLIFIYNQQVNWFWAGLLTIGQGLGAYIGSTFAIKYENSAIWIRRLLILVIIAAIIKFFNLWTFFS